MLSTAIIILVVLVLSAISFSGANDGYLPFKYRVVKNFNVIYLEYKSMFLPFIWLSVEKDWFNNPHSDHMRDPMILLKRKKDVNIGQDKYLFRNAADALDICDGLNKGIPRRKKTVITRPDLELEQINEDIEKKLQEQGLYEIPHN